MKLLNFNCFTVLQTALLIPDLRLRELVCSMLSSDCAWTQDKKFLCFWWHNPLTSWTTASLSHFYVFCEKLHLNNNNNNKSVTYLWETQVVCVYLRKKFKKNFLIFTQENIAYSNRKGKMGCFPRCNHGWPVCSKVGRRGPCSRRTDIGPFTPSGLSAEPNDSLRLGCYCPPC